MLRLHGALLLCWAACIRGDVLSPMKLLELVSSIPSELGWMDPNMYFQAQRNSGQFPYDEYVTGYEDQGKPLKLEINYKWDSPECEEKISEYLAGSAVSWDNEYILHMPCTALTVDSMEGLASAMGDSAQALASVGLYVPPQMSQAAEQPFSRYAKVTQQPVDDALDEVDEDTSTVVKRREAVIPTSAKAEGLFRTRLADFIARTGVDGTGITVGVMSDSANAGTPDLTTLILQGLVRNPVTVLADAGGTNEGAAMVNIVADMCPGCKIVFATALPTEQAFANNIRLLANAGCNIIVDDISYVREEVFQEGVVEQAVTEVTQRGVLYFSSATNSGNVVSGAQDTYLAPYSPTVLAGAATDEHNFIPGVIGNPFTAAQFGPLQFLLQWSVGSLTGTAIPLRFALLIINTVNGGVIASGTPPATETRPSLVVSVPGAAFTNGVTYTARVIRVPGTNWPATIPAADRRIYLQMPRSPAQFQAFTRGATYGHNAPFRGFGVAAVDTQKLVTPFTTANVVETFSSDGRTPRCFLPIGLYIGCTDKSQPLVAGPDGVSTSVAGFNPFFGTSAAAPAVAALVAVLRQRYADFLSPNQLKLALESGRVTLDIMASGLDRESGWGLLDAILLDQELQARRADTLKPACVPVPKLLKGYGCNKQNDNCDSQGLIDECAEDIFQPDIKIFEIPKGTWFTNTGKLLARVAAAVKAVDDCSATTITTPTLTIKKCAASAVTIKAKDACNNEATAVIPVLFDDQKPTVKLELKQAKKLSDKKLDLKHYVDVGLKMRATDDCTARLPVRITVFCDELDPEEEEPSAVLYRKQDKAEFKGWGLWLQKKAARKCQDPTDHTLCTAADGRVYAVRLCATDEAGNEKCKVAFAGVPLSDKAPALDQDKFFVVTEETAILG